MVEIIEIDNDSDGISCSSGSSRKNPVSLEASDDDEVQIVASYAFPVGMSRDRRAKRVIDLNVEFIDVEEEGEPSPGEFNSFNNLGVKRGFDLNVACVEDEVQGIDELPPPKKRNRCGSSDSRVDDHDDHDDVGLESRVGLHMFKCEICVEDKPFHQLFVIKSCNHHYCSECVKRYVASKLDDSIPHITCPVSGCEGLLDPEECQEILPAQVFDRWGDALCESLFPASQKFYCPYKNCSGLLLDDCKRRKKVMKKFECLHCKRLFCFECKSPWHPRIKCEEFQKLNKDGLEAEDIMMMKLAKSKKWQRCPTCKFYVQRNEGCRHITCRCGHQFCYRCGATWPRCCTDGSCR